MIQPSHITDRMIRGSENRAGRDSRGGSVSERNINRADAQDGGKAASRAFATALFPDADIQKPRTYQIEPE